MVNKADFESDELKEADLQYNDDAQAMQSGFAAPVKLVTADDRMLSHRAVKTVNGMS